LDDYSAYQSAELAELYDAVYADSGDGVFWEAMAATAKSGPLLELGCGTGRVLLPLARAGHEVTGIDLAAHMLQRCRDELSREPLAVRDRVTLLEADMTAFDLGRRFEHIYCAFGTFHHLRTVEQQLGCLGRCREHLLPGGRLVLDLINPDPAIPAPAPADIEAEAPTDDGTSTGPVDWTAGRRVHGWVTVVGTDRSLQCNDCEVIYEITEQDGSTRRVSETFPMRFIFRYELEHLLARCGFSIVSLYGDYDRSAFADESPGMIVVAEQLGE
jgi:SAM-dependent methyltransferase